MENTKWKTITVNFLMAVLLLIIGGFLNSYFFKDKPELTYNVYEGDPIETDLGDYYSTNVVINNTGDVPLSTVRAYFKFNGRVIKVSTNFHSDKNEDDSLGVRREFRMPTGTLAQIKITSRGKLQDTNISSAEVVARKREGTSDKEDMSSILLNLGASLSGMMALTILLWMMATLRGPKKLKLK